MNDIKGRKLMLAGVSGLLLASLSLGAGAQTANTQPAGATASPGATTGTTGTNSHGRVQAKGEDKQDAHTHIAKAEQTVKKMEQDPQVRKMLQQAKGVFLIPDYGRAALGVGAQGGAGVLVAHQGGKWASPGFYNFGGVSVGAQAGVSAGQIAMLLMSDKALNSFGSNNKFALNADAGLTIIDWSKRATASAGHGDIVMWSDAKGAFADLNVGVTDVNFDEEETKAFYGKPVTAQDIVSGKETSAKAKSLISALSAK
jgi:lipid-binding SYLF domain-containing protein